MYTPYEAEEKLSVAKMLTLHQTSSQMTVHYWHYYLRLTKYHPKAIEDIAVVCIFASR